MKNKEYMTRVKKYHENSKNNSNLENENSLKKSETRQKKQLDVEKKEKSLKIKQANEKTLEELNDIEDKKTNPLLKKILISCLGIFIILIIYMMFIEPSLISIKEYKIESSTLASSFHGMKIVQISDIHYGTTINKKQLDKVVKKVNEVKPDIIVFTGDLINKNIVTTDEIIQELKDGLSKMNANLYKYAIYGNEDMKNDKFEEIMNDSNFKILDNESTLLYYKDNIPIVITGFSSAISDPDYSLLDNKVNEIDVSNCYKLVLSHEPDSIDEIAKYNPDLVLSGHSLGGLIKLPLFKPLFLDTGAKKYYDSEYIIDGTSLFVSNGLGTSGLNIRLGNKPSINLYRLYSY